MLIDDINNSNIKKIYKEKFDDVEKYLSKSTKSKNVNQLKNYIKKIKEIISDDENDNGHKKTSSKIKAEEAISCKDQKGKGYINLTIFLSKMYAINSSKKPINDIEQLVKNLYDNKQITKQVYNNLVEAITYKNDS